MEIISGAKKQLDEIAAEIISDSLFSVLKRKKFAVFAVPGGRSVEGVFASLKKAAIPWEKIQIFLADERLAPISCQESNYKLVFETLINPLIKLNKLPRQNVHPFIYQRHYRGNQIKEYEEEIKRYGDGYDVLLLSCGEDGHIAGLFPEHSSIVDDSNYYLIYHDSPKLPKDRMTLSRKMLLRTETALVLLLGKTKQRALRNLLDKSLSCQNCPARLVEQIKHSYLLTDQHLRRIL